MKHFTDLLNEPLPSKRAASSKNINESAEDDFDSLLADEENTPDTDEDNDSDEDDNEDCDDCTGATDPDDVTEWDGELNDSESQHVDDVIKIAATPIMLMDVLGEEGCKEFAESVDAQISIDEAYTTEKTIVRMDKDSKKKRLFEIAVLAVAKEKNDPLFKKLDTAYRIERTIKDKLRKKYKAEANRRVQKYLQQARQSQSSAIATTAKKLSK